VRRVDIHRVPERPDGRQRRAVGTVDDHDAVHTSRDPAAGAGDADVVLLPRRR
jgi:hypothetical protein